jgi:hypothetical protein
MPPLQLLHRSNEFRFSFLKLNRKSLPCHFHFLFGYLWLQSIIKKKNQILIIIKKKQIETNSQTVKYTTHQTLKGKL